MTRKDLIFVFVGLCLVLGCGDVSDDTTSQIQSGVSTTNDADSGVVSPESEPNCVPTGEGICPEGCTPVEAYVAPEAVCPERDLHLLHCDGIPRESFNFPAQGRIAYVNLETGDVAWVVNLAQIDPNFGDEWEQRVFSADCWVVYGE